MTKHLNRGLEGDGFEPITECGIVVKYACTTSKIGWVDCIDCLKCLVENGEIAAKRLKEIP